MQTSELRAFSDDTYRDVLGITDEKEINYAEHLVRALGQIDPTLLPKGAGHPFASLIAAGQAGVEELLRAAESEDEKTRFDALDAMAHVFIHGGATDQAVVRLKQLMHVEKKPELIACFAKCIAISGDESFLVEQMTRLADDDPGVIAAASRFLGYGAYAPAVPVLVTLVSPAHMVESGHVIWALGEIGSFDALPALEHALSEGFRTCECMIAIGKVGSITSIPKLTPMMLSGLPEQRDAAYRALAMILHANRDTPEVVSMVGDELVGVIIRQLEELGKSLSVSTRFHMLLCLARVNHKLDAARVRRFLGVELDEKEAGDIASFFVKRGSYKN